MADDQASVTRLLDAIREGERAAADRLFEVVYSELRRMARVRAARDSPSAPTPTSIVHEAYLRLVGEAERFESRSHFFGAAAEAMRRILIDDARRRHALKRGGPEGPVTLHETAAAQSVPPAEVLDVDRALSRLEGKDAQMANVVKLRYFAGMTIPETAAATGLSERTVNRSWVAARAWLQREMKRDRT